MEHKTNYTGRYFHNRCVSSKQLILTYRAEEQHGPRHVYKEVSVEFEETNQKGQNPKSGLKLHQKVE
jgi:hypothetical protein